MIPLLQFQAVLVMVRCACLLLLCAQAARAQQAPPDGTYSVKESWSVSVNESPYSDKMLTRSGVATGMIEVVDGTFDLIDLTHANANSFYSTHRTFNSAPGCIDLSQCIYGLYDGVPVLWGVVPAGMGTVTQNGCVVEFSNAALLVGLSFSVVPVPVGSLQLDVEPSEDNGYTTAVGADGLAYEFQGTDTDVNGEEFDVSSTSTLTLLAAYTNTPAPSPSPTPTPVQTSTCVGDCNGYGEVTVNEILTMVNIALGTADPTACASGIPSGSSVDIALILRAVNNDLSGGCG